MELTKIKTGENRNKYWPIALMMVLYADFTFCLANFGFSPLMALIKSDLFLNQQQIAAVAGVAGIIAVVTLIPTSILTERFGSRMIASVSIGMTVFGFIIILVTGTYPGLLTGRIVWSAFYRAALGATMALTVLVVPPELKGRAIGLNGSVACLGGAFGAQTSVYGVERFGSWHGALYLFAFFAVTGMVAVAAFGRRYNPGMETTAQTGDDVRPAWKTSGSWLLAGLMLLLSSGGVVIIMNSLILSEHFNEPIRTAARIQSIGNFIGAAVIPFIGWIGDRFSCWKALFVAAAVQVVSIVLMLSSNLDIFIPGACVAGFMAVCTSNMVYLAVPTFLNKTDIGGSMGVISFGTGMAIFLFPGIFAFSYDNWGSYNFALAAMAAMTAAAAVISVILGSKGKNHDAGAGGRAG